MATMTGLEIILGLSGSRPNVKFSRVARSFSKYIDPRFLRSRSKPASTVGKAAAAPSRQENSLPERTRPRVMVIGVTRP